MAGLCRALVARMGAERSDTHHVSAQRLMGIAALHPSYGSPVSFRLAENVSALPLLKPCGMIAREQNSKPQAMRQPTREAF